MRLTNGLQKRKMLRASLAGGIRRPANGVGEPRTVSGALESAARLRRGPLPALPHRPPAYTPDVSHLVV